MTDLFEQELQKLNLPSDSPRLSDPIRHTLRAGGKRLRPQLVFLGCRLTGGSEQDALPAALAVELIHNFTLIHDDIMDDAATRRGEPTVYQKWGSNDAILSGDYLFALATEQLLRYKDYSAVDKHRFARMFETFFSGIKTVCEGQSRDLEFEAKIRVSLEDYLGMIGQKTATLLQTSIELGALAGRAGEDELQNLGNMAYEAGLAFQIQDDLLDATGNAETFGKRIGGDIREQKKTCLFIIAFENSDSDQQKKLTDYFAGNEITERGVQEVIDIFHTSGAIREAKKLLDTYYQRAVARLDQFGDTPARAKIKELFEQLRIREN